MKKKSYIIDNKLLMSEWDYEKNKNLDPSKLTLGSHTKAWWKCKLGHQFEMTIKQRTYGQSCPYCSNKKVLVGYNDLQTTHPNIAKQWHPTKNGSLTPQQLTFGSGKRIWWLCSRCGYEWITSVLNRTQGKSCPLCLNKVVVRGYNDLATLMPDLAKEWHPTKNGSLTPHDVVCGSQKKVWWICPLGHDYETKICLRTHGSKCPICDKGKHTSFAEQAIFFYVKKLYPDAISSYHAEFLGKMELDIFIPSINYAIEYDGEPWHNRKKGVLERDQKKYQLCKENGIRLVRIQEKMSPIGSNVSDWSLSIEKIHKYENLEYIIYELLKKLDFSGKYFLRKFGINITRDQFEIQKYKLSIREKNSLEKLFPDIAKEWNYHRNGNLTPKMFVPGSHKKMWWTCSVCGYEYFMSIYHRTQRKQGCKKCGIERIKERQSVPVEMIDINTNKVIKMFVSIFEASIQMKITKSNICMACKGQRQTAGGYRWKYAEVKD